MNVRGALMVVALLSIASVGRDGDVKAGPTLTRRQALADLHFWWKRLWQVHPSPALAQSEEELRRAYSRVQRTLPAQVSELDLWMQLSRLAAMVEDSHTGFHPLTPALPVRVARDGSVFLRDAVGELRTGTSIQTIDGRPVRELVRWARQFASAENASGQDLVVPNILGTIYPTPLLVASNGDWARVPAPMNRRAQQAVEVTPLASGVLLLRVRSFAIDLSDFRRWTNGFFARVANSPPRALIVDLRGNAGGNTENGRVLLSHLTSQPIRMFAEKQWRVSEPMKRQVEALGRYFERYLRSKSQMLRQPVQPRVMPANHRFLGPVVFLVDTSTASAAMMTADAVEAFDLGVIVGQPPASPPNYYGESYSFTLPCSGLTGTIASARFIRASGDPGMHRVRVGIPVQLDATEERAQGLAHAAALRMAERDEQLRGEAQ